MKVVEHDKEVPKEKVGDLGGGKAFSYEGEKYIRLVARGECNNSVNSQNRKTYIGNLMDGQIVVVRDDMMVTPLNAEVHIWSE